MGADHVFNSQVAEGCPGADVGAVHQVGHHGLTASLQAALVRSRLG